MSRRLRIAAILSLWSGWCSLFGFPCRSHGQSQVDLYRRPMGYWNVPCNERQFRGNRFPMIMMWLILTGLVARLLASAILGLTNGGANPRGRGCKHRIYQHFRKPCRLFR